MLKRWFHRTVLSRRWLTFIVMGLAFFAFGAGTFNIFMLFSANAAVISSYGWQALMDGAAVQFVELVVTGYLSMAAYVVFKACEYRLTRDVSEPADTKGR
jgi:membrane protein implicated in regulation of membrane protease activity